MTDTEITLDARLGSEITGTIRDMITMAGESGAMVKTDFNGVTVRVRSDSDPTLIYRDWSRAMSGYIDKIVGPYSRPDLTPEEIASDARIEEENEQRRKERDAQYAAEATAKSAATSARLAVAPLMDVTDGDAWQSWKDSNTDPYGSAVIRYAEVWARLMQAEIDGGAELEDVADSTSSAADTEGITGFMYGAAVHCLAQSWVHGDRLRKWHNRQWGASEDASGTVNPAVMTISPED